MPTIHLTILKWGVDSLSIKIPDTSTFRLLNEEISRQTGIEPGKIMLYQHNRELVNNYEFLPITYSVQDHDTLLLLIADHIHPKYIPLPYLNKPPPLYRLNNVFEHQHPNDIPDHLKDDANTYFINKKNKRDQFYYQSPIGQQYLEELRQSLDYWNINHF
jgi:hypothetical protein